MNNKVFIKTIHNWNKKLLNFTVLMMNDWLIDYQEEEKKNNGSSHIFKYRSFS